MSRFGNPSCVNEAIVGAWPRWLGGAGIARALCRCGLHAWWLKPTSPGVWYPDGNRVICGRCGTRRGW
jgi:hypothetical protein